MVDEIFGNQYVKKEKLKDVVDNTVREWINMIRSAVNPMVSGASMPVDLMPELRPLYTTKARQAGVEGTVILELVVSKDGKVLRARPVGKKLGHGLEWEAVKVFKMKKFKPSTDPSGNALTVKFFQPVRFVLM